MTPAISDIRTYAAQITDRLVNGASMPTGSHIDDPSNVRYSAVATDTLDSVAVTNVNPIRRAAGIEVYTLERGDWCLIRVRRGFAPELICPTELPHWVEACNPP